MIFSVGQNRRILYSHIDLSHMLYKYKHGSTEQLICPNNGTSSKYAFTAPRLNELINFRSCNKRLTMRTTSLMGLMVQFQIQSTMIIHCS